LKYNNRPPVLYGTGILNALTWCFPKNELSKINANSLVDDHPVVPATLVDARVTAAAILFAGPTRAAHQFRRVGGQVEAIAVRQPRAGRGQQLPHFAGRHVDQHVAAVAPGRIVIVADRHRRLRLRHRQHRQHQPPPERVPVRRHRGAAEPRLRVVRLVRRTTLPDGRRGRVTVARAADRFDRAERPVPVPACGSTAAGIGATVHRGDVGRDVTMAEREPQNGGGETRSDGLHSVRTLLRRRPFAVRRRRRRPPQPPPRAAAAATRRCYDVVVVTNPRANGIAN